MQEVHDPLKVYGAEIVALSPQDIPNSKETVAQLGLHYPNCADAKNAVAALYGLRYEFPDYAIEAYKSIGANLPDYNGEDSWSLPVPAVYIIRPDGVIHHAQVDVDYRQRMEPADIVETVRTIAKRE